MNNLIFSTLLFFLVSVCNGLLVLPFKNVPGSIASGGKISIPVSNDKFIISSCAALGSTYLYTESNEVTEYSPVAYFKDDKTLELYIPEVGNNNSKKYFIVVELPLAEAIIKTDAFTITAGSKINLPKTDGCGKVVKFSNKDSGKDAQKSSNGNTSDNKSGSTSGDNKSNFTLGSSSPSSPNGNDNKAGITSNLNASNNNTNTNGNNNGNANGNNNLDGANGKNGNNDNKNGADGNNKNGILNAENTSKTSKEADEPGNNNTVVIACAGTGVVALVVISGLVFMRKRSYKNGDGDVSYSSLNYVNPKPYNPVGGLYDNLTNTNDEFDRDYQLKCLNNSDNHSNVSYPISLSDGSGVNMDKTDVFEAAEDVPVPELPKDLPVTKHVVEEIVINPEKVMSETINANAVSAVVTTASVALAINECGDLTINNSNIVIEKPDETMDQSETSCSSCSSCSCSTCSGSCSCSSCNDSSRYTSTTNNESSLKLLSLDFNTKPFSTIDFGDGDTTRGYSVFVDNENEKSKTDSVALDSNRLTTYTETNYDDSRRDTQYTDYTSYTEDSRRNTAYTDYTSYTEDSRRDTQYTDYTVDSRRDTQYTDYTVDSRRDTQYTDYTVDSRRDTQYTDYTVDSRRDTQYTDYTVDSRRDTQYTDYTEGTSYTNDSRRYTDYTEGSSYTTNRDSRYTDYTEGSSYSSCSCSGSECDCSRRNTQYSEYTSDYTSYTTDSRRYTSEYTTDMDSSRRQTYTTDFSSQYSSDFCEAHDATDSEAPSRILPLSTIEPFGDSMNSGLLERQSAIRDSISGLLPTGPIEGKPPKFDIEFVAQHDYEPTKPGELKIKANDIVQILENLEGGCYMASNTTTGQSGKIPAYKILSLL